MEKRMRVYPVEKDGGSWLGKLILFLSAVVILSGLVWREDGGELSIRTVPTPSPIPLDEAFDETLTEVEITLPSSVWYALQLGAFETEQAAQETAEQYARRGAGGFVWQDGRYRALAAVYPSREDAQNVRERLSEQHQVETYLYEIALPAMRLRLTGMKGQTEILEAAFIHASDLAQQLYMLSNELDRQEISVEECIANLAALGENAQTVSARLEQRFTRPRPSTVDELAEMFRSFCAFSQTLSGEESSATLGGSVKYQNLATLNMLKHVYDTMSHT